MRAARAVPAVLTALTAGVLLAACGSADRAATEARPSATRQAAAVAAAASVPPPAPAVREAPPVGPPRDDLGLPPHVPLRATGAAVGGDVRVIRRWMAALRAGDIRRAARSFRLPSRFQSGTPVLWLSVPDERERANRSLSCGARLLGAGASGAYVIVRMRLVQRPGAACGRFAGRTSRAAIRVEFAEIVEFYRLPSDPRATPARLLPHPARGTDEPVA